jgi:pentose-5-phosphate-3-epimerase
MIIIPGVFPQSFEEITDKLFLLADISRTVQIGLCDGSYGLPVTWSPHGREILPVDFIYEFDLILTSWREYIIKAYQLGAKRVVVHIDEFSEQDFQDLLKFVYSYGMTLGLTVSNDISVDVLTNAVRRIEQSTVFNDMNRVFVQVMGVRHISETEHPFDERVLPRIRVLKNFFPNLVVQVSGRMNPETAKLVHASGADRMVVGSYIFSGGAVEDALASLKKAIEEENGG